MNYEGDFEKYIKKHYEKNRKKHNKIRIIGIILLLGTFFDFPYGYFQLMRWYIFIAGIYLFYKEKNSPDSEYIRYKFGRPIARGIRIKKECILILYIVMIILFNPIIPIYFDRETWQILDIITAIYLGYILIID